MRNLIKCENFQLCCQLLASGFIRKNKTKRHLLKALFQHSINSCSHRLLLLLLNEPALMAFCSRCAETGIENSSHTDRRALQEELHVTKNKQINVSCLCRTFSVSLLYRLRVTAAMPKAIARRVEPTGWYTYFP